MGSELTKPFRYKRIALDQPSTKKKLHARDRIGTLKRIWSYLAVYRKGLAFVVFLVVLSSVLSLTAPLLIGRIIDDFLETKNSQQLVPLLLVLVLIYIFQSISMWLQNFWMVGIAQQTVYTMRTQLFRHFHRLPISYFDKRQHGESMSKVTNDIENISTTLNRSIIQIFSSILTFVGICVVMLYLSPLLTVITLTIVPAMVVGMKWITRRTSVFFKKQQQHLGDVNGFIEETISGQKIVKAFSQEERVMLEFKRKNEQLRGIGFWAQTYSGFIPKYMNVLNNLSFAVIALVGGLLVLHKAASIGVIVVFAEYSRQFTRPLNDLANQFNTLLSAIAGAERVFAVMDEEPEQDKGGATVLQKVKGDVVFQDVSFSYDEEDQTIKDASFSVSSGETVAIVGPTGAGKTTIINLLSRLYDPDEGKILLDGRDITLATRESLREQMGFVLQDSYLFQGTIRENIRYGKIEASNEEVERAAKLANAYSFISKLPGGFETVLDQDGGGISHGERQLLSIARAMLKDPPLLILDEATSSVDTITEMKIQEALHHLMKGRTSFVIAHRLNTIQLADQILVLREGELIEKGTHDQLIEREGAYFRMYHRK
ncbi:ABC transporter ATP-binding protein [bacterium LRH843]|nr:ABC transporter ATP-binding protein [bacterium LRH843]